MFIKGPSSIDSLLLILILKILIVIFFLPLASFILVLLIKIKLSILDMEHMAFGASSVSDSIRSEYDNNDIKFPVERFIFPKNESWRHAANK